MTKEILTESSTEDNLDNEKYAQKQKMVADLVEKSLPGYEVPKVLDATVCILSQYFAGSETCLFGDEPHTYTHC